MTRWTHKVEPEEPHPVDPHYEVNGKPAYWTCYTCNPRTPILLDEKKPPITAGPTGTSETDESPMSSQP